MTFVIIPDAQNQVSQFDANREFAQFDSLRILLPDNRRPPNPFRPDKTDGNNSDDIVVRGGRKFVGRRIDPVTCEITPLIKAEELIAEEKRPSISNEVNSVEKIENEAGENKPNVSLLSRIYAFACNFFNSLKVLGSQFIEFSQTILYNLGFRKKFYPSHIKT